MYVPNPTFEGADSFAYAAADDSTLSEPVTVVIEVLSPAAALALRDGSGRRSKHHLEEDLSEEDAGATTDESSAVKPNTNTEVNDVADGASEGFLVELGPSGVRAYPNPFNARVTVEFDLDQTTWVTAWVYNARGQRLRALYQGQQNSGRHKLLWDGRNETGTEVQSGVYFLRLHMGERASTFRLILIK
jgi:hypothetical protein